MLAKTACAGLTGDVSFGSKAEVVERADLVGSGPEAAISLLVCKWPATPLHELLLPWFIPSGLTE